MFQVFVPLSVTLRARPSAPESNLSICLPFCALVIFALIYYWNACVLGKVNLTGDVFVKRRLMSEEGEVIHELDEIPFELEPQPANKKLRCHIALETVPPNTLSSGEYEFDIVIAYANGNLISHATAPLQVK